jgi:hypothetical protein
VTLFRRFLRLYLPIASAIVAVGAFAAFATTARLVWSWRAAWTREATIGAAVAVALFLVGALFLRLAIYQPWRRRLDDDARR